MSSKQTLNDLVDALASGAIEIVDLSGPLGPKTPLIKIPPEYGPDTPPIEIHSQPPEYFGRGIGSNSANIPAHILMHRRIGSQAKITQMARRIKFRSRASSRRLA